MMNEVISKTSLLRLMIQFNAMSGCSFAGEMFTFFRVFSVCTFVMKRFISYLPPIESEEHGSTTELFAHICKFWCRESLNHFDKSSVYYFFILCELPLGRDMKDEEFFSPNRTLVVEGLMDGVLDLVIRGPIESWGGTWKKGEDRYH